MPTSTFFRLPEEKQQRLVDASWEEFTQTRYIDASIARIIQAARIPRGSFYQYFTDKDDLFGYLLEDVREQFKAVLTQILDEEDGDLYRLPVRAFDLFMTQNGVPFPLLQKVISLLKSNQGMDIRLILTDSPGVLPPEMIARLDKSRFRLQEDKYINSIFSLMVASLAGAIMETLCAPEQWKIHRDMLEERIEIIRDGSAARTEGGE